MLYSRWVFGSCGVRCFENLLDHRLKVDGATVSVSEICLGVSMV